MGSSHTLEVGLSVDCLACYMLCEVKVRMHGQSNHMAWPIGVKN